MRIFEKANFDFVGNRKVGYLFSGAMVLIALAGIIIRGLQFGIDFKGGKEFVISFDQPVSVSDVRSTLTTPLGTQPETKIFGSPKELLLRVDSDKDLNDLTAIINTTLAASFPENKSEIVKTDVVGPRFAEDLKRGALLAIIFSLIMIFGYILIRFRNWRFSAGAVAALAHDVIVVLGAITIFDHFFSFSLDLDQNMIAAMLTIVGYSINDTVVIFDRIRENLQVHKNEPLESLVNRSINQTLSRTIITTGTTLFVVAGLFLFGGEVLKGLSFALLVGMVAGTYSTIFVASPLYIDLSKK
jgi:preprotein translocase SecF subunit